MQFANFLRKTISNVRVFSGKRQGIPTLEIVVGDYLRDWQIAEVWEEVEFRMAQEREMGVRVVEETRDPEGKFRTYVVEANDVTKGRM